MKILVAIILMSMTFNYIAEEFHPLSFIGKDFTTGEDFAFKQYSNKVVYIDFWASWCAPCRESMPFLEKLYQNYNEQGFEIIAINIDEIKSDAKQFIHDFPISYSNMYDPKGEIGKKLNIKSMPTAYLIGRDGKVIVRHSGFNKKYGLKLENKIKHLLKN